MSGYSDFLGEFQFWLREYGPDTVMADFQKVNPELHEAIKKSLTKDAEYDKIPALLKRKLSAD